MTIHQPVLLEACTRTIFQEAFEKFLGTKNRNQDGRSAISLLVDLTLGGGGHTAAMLQWAENTKAKFEVWSVDQDEEAISRARKRFHEPISEGRLRLIHDSFSNDELWNEVKQRGGALGILADLGYSSDQLEDSKRGLSFQKEGPLDMRLNPHAGLPLSALLQEVEENELADILFQFGEERYSRRISRAIIEAKRGEGIPTNTLALAELIRRAYPSKDRHGKIHCATRSFQAFRIWVNGELEALDKVISQGLSHLQVGGRFGIITFHSLEDRRVKQGFRNAEDACEPFAWAGLNFQRVNKKVIEATPDEVEKNPRSRSAKLRVIERLVK